MLRRLIGDNYNVRQSAWIIKFTYAPIVPAPAVRLAS
jgi:hypothetical protein